jgi:hypothetical protein
VPAKLETPQAGFRYLWLNFPEDSVPQPAVLQELRVLHDTGGFEDIDDSPNEIPVFVDVKPGSCPNPLNLKAKGVVSVAVLGSELLDVSTIDPFSIRIAGTGVAPLRHAYEDTATPYVGQAGGCHELTADGYTDLVLKFRARSVIDALGAVTGGDGNLPMALEGRLSELYGSVPIFGRDYVRIR